MTARNSSWIAPCIVELAMENRSVNPWLSRKIVSISLLKMGRWSCIYITERVFKKARFFALKRSHEGEGSRISHSFGFIYKITISQRVVLHESSSTKIIKPLQVIWEWLFWPLLFCVFLNGIIWNKYHLNGNFWIELFELLFKIAFKNLKSEKKNLNKNFYMYI